MSATTKLGVFGVLGGLTSSSDARAHLVVLGERFSFKAFKSWQPSLLFTLRGINRRSKTKILKIILINK
jgi:hypothetical protein